MKEKTHGYPRYWYNNEIVRSSVFNASSSIIPLLEYYVLDAVDDSVPHINDEKLIHDAKQLRHDEEAHIQVHERYNTLLKEEGYRLMHIQSFGRWFLKIFDRAGVKTRLALCACGEYFTTLMAKHSLENGIFIDGDEIDERLRRVWIWHSLEEINHRGTAFAMYRKMGGGYFKRILIYFISTIFIFFIHLWATVSILRQDRNLFKAHVIWDLIRFMFGKRGCYSSLITKWALFLKPSFTPYSLPINQEIIRTLHHRHIEDKLLPL